MNKWKALGLGLLFLILAIIVWANGGDILGWWLMPFALWFLPQAGWKFYRDWAIVSQAKAELAAAAQQPPALPPETTPEERTPIGRLIDGAQEFFIKVKDRFAGIYLLGVQGVGKSAMLVNLILHDALAGSAVIVIDPHGDLVRDCLKRLPEHLLHKVYWLNMEDEEHPFGVNVFGRLKSFTSIALAQAVDRVMHIFEVVWADVLKQQYLPRYLRAAIIVLLANPGMTLVDMRRFLLDDQFRAMLLKNVTDPTVVDFWQTQYEELSDNDRMKRVQPLLGRLELLFMGRSIVRNILGQPETSIDFRKAIEDGLLIFITLPTKSLTQDARLIGTMLVAQIHAAVFSFADLPANKRPGVSLVIDEFQNFVTPDIAELFAEGRKFGLKTVVCHQFRGQLPEYLRQATMTARTKICFRLTPDDAHEMSHLFRSKQTEVRPEDIDRFLRPLQSMRSGGKVKITPKFNTLTALRGGDIPTYTVWDPTLHLDTFLYEVMTTRNARLPIPLDIVEGFSGCGHGFYHEWRHVLDKEWWVGPDITFPPALVVQRPDGTMEWTRRPDDGREELYHFIFCLRRTMLYLIEHPIGEATTLTTSEIAGQLMELPNREMYIRAGDEVGRVRTTDMTKPVPAAELQERLAAIQQQTHDKYCTPKAEVEARLLQPYEQKKNTHADTPIRRWEEI